MERRAWKCRKDNASGEEETSRGKNSLLLGTYMGVPVVRNNKGEKRRGEEWEGIAAVSAARQPWGRGQGPLGELYWDYGHARAPPIVSSSTKDGARGDLSVC